MIFKIEKETIPAKQRSKGRIARLNELLRKLLHFSDAEKISFRERRPISPITTEIPYWGSPGVVTMEIALAEIALDDITLNNILILLHKGIYFIYWEGTV
jgi:hypothetical protein